MMGDLWVFGYGSLMWDPGFPFLARRPALLRGYHRALCVYSHVWRGTPACPGLVLGLDRGGACRGIAFRVAADEAAQVIDYLDRRERVTEVYVRKPMTVLLAGGERVVVETYVVDRAHLQYAGRLDPQESVRLVRQGSGRGGANFDYLENTVRHLDEMGLKEGALHDLARLVRGGH
ncbi:MAG: cation transport protein ChaC [Alphaproteobacteria bacterium]|jgi:cation transport protein ChaC